MADIDVNSGSKDRQGLTNVNVDKEDEDFYVDILDMDLFPGPHSERREKRRRKKKKEQGKKDWNFIVM